MNLEIEEDIKNFIKTHGKLYRKHYDYKKKLTLIFKEKNKSKFVKLYQSDPILDSILVQFQYESKINEQNIEYLQYQYKLKNDYNHFLEKYSNLANKTIMTSPKINKYVMVYRGSNRQSHINLKKGDIYTDKTLLATSLDLSHSFSFFPGFFIKYPKDKNIKCCMYEIILPPNSDLLFLIPAKYG